MKIFLGSLMALLMCQNAANACDVCGCGSMGSSNQALWGMPNQHRIGIGFQGSYFRSEHLPSILKGASQEQMVSNEAFYRYEVRGSHPLFNGKLVLGWTLPVNAMSKSGSTEKTSTGLGDASVQLGIQLFEDSLFSGKWRTFGTARLKMPTGQYDAAAINETVSRYMFPGTGSWDQSLSVTSRWSNEKSVWEQNIAFRHNGKTHDGLNWGNQWSVNAAYFHQVALKNMVLFPGLRVHYEQRIKDHNKVQTYRYSGYSIALLSPELNVQWQKWQGACFYRIPVFENIAEGQVDLHAMFGISINYSL